MSLLVAIQRQRSAQDMAVATNYIAKAGSGSGEPLKLEVTLDKFAEFFAVFVAHVDEFDATAIRSDVANDCSEVDLAETGADLKLDRVADTEFPRGFQIGATQADGLYSGKACRRALDLRAKW